MIAAADRLKKPENIDPSFALTVDLPLPPSANALFANAAKGRVRTKEYNNWLNEARWHVLTAWRNAGKPVAPDDVPMSITILLGIKGRRRDCSNAIKALEDVLVKELPIPDDRWNDHGSWKRCPETPEGVARVTIAVMNPP